MTEHERNIVLNLLGVNKNKIKDFSVIWSGTYYWIVSGKFYMKYADYIDLHAPDDFKIRVEGGCEDWKPKDYASNEALNEYNDQLWQKHINDKAFSIKLLSEESSRKREELLKTDYDNFYIGMYHIDTLDGLVWICKFINDMDSIVNN
jgi:hypothetical protein